MGVQCSIGTLRESTQSFLGVARIYAKQKEIRDRNPDTTIFLNAGEYHKFCLKISNFTKLIMFSFFVWIVLDNV